MAYERPDRWEVSGDAAFKEFGLNQFEHDHYGFRSFKVIATTTRKKVTINSKVHRGPLQLMDHPMNGRLAGIVREYVYGPGDNTAACQPWNGSRHPSAPALLENGKPHGCGFYAYSLPDHPDANPIPHNSYDGGIDIYVRAVVQGSGKRVVGTKGFTCEKLRIVAIAFPVLCSLFDSHSGDGRHAHELFGPKLERLITKNYPDAAIFNSTTRMLHEFPLTPPPEKPTEDMKPRIRLI